MKKFLYSAMLVLSTFLLASCGSKQADLSGTYYYAQSYGSGRGADNVTAVHRLDIRKTDQSNKNYKVKEIGVSGVALDDELGTLEVDGDLLNMSLPHPSDELDAELQPYTIEVLDISQIIGQKYTLKKGVLTIGEGTSPLELYKDSTDKGQEYQEIYINQ